MMKRKPTITEREIKSRLSAMREEVAAPRDFRSKIINRLAVETGQAAPASGASLWNRLVDFAARPLLVPALAASLMLAFGIYIATRPAAPEQAPGSMPVIAVKTAPRLAAVHPNPAKAKVQIAKAAAVKAVELEEGVTVIQGSEVAQAQAAAGNSDSAPAISPSQNKQLSDPNSQAPSFGGSSSAGSAPSGGPSASGNPTAVIEPTATPLPKPLEGNSQVRRNKFLVSRGEYASILFKLKAPGKVRIEAYDRNGKLVAVIHEGQHSGGVFEVRWYGHDDNGQIAPTGIYLIRVKTDEYDQRHKAVLVK